MEIRKVSIDMLNPAKYNPRKDLQPSDTQYQSLQRAINEFGYVEPIIWNERSSNVVGGHQRLKILLENGCTEIDVSVVNLDDPQEKALNIVLNKVSGVWDTEKLTVLFQDLHTTLPDVSVTGFASIEMEDILQGNTIDIDSLFVPLAAKDAVTAESESIQCPHCSQWFETTIS